MPEDSSELKSAVLRAKGGDPAAFAELVRRLQNTIVGFAWSVLGDHGRAQDAAQEAFLEAFLRLDDLREPALVGPWLRAIAFSKCQRVLRRANHNEAASASVTGAEHSQAPDEALQLRGDLLRAIATLPETERTVVALFYVSGLAQREIGNFLEVPISTVKNRLSSARRRLKEFLMTDFESELRAQRPSIDPAFGQRVAWFRAVDAKDIASIARLLLETPALVHERRRREEEPPPGVRWGVTALHLAAQRDDARVAELLIEAGADLESRATGTDAPGGGTPLHWAAKFGAFDVVKLLVESGANVNPAEDIADQVSSGAQGSLLELLSHQAIAAYLIAHGAEVSIFSAVMLELEDEARKILDADRSKVQETRFLDFTPLHVAARKDLPQMIDLLLAYGAPRDIPDRLARTPIDVALLAGRTLAYDRLAAHGARPSEHARASAGTIERSEQLRRFLDACLEDLPAAEAMLALEPALANTTLPHFWENNYVGGTALHLAAALGRTELAQLLLRFGADRSLKDEKYGGTPSGWAKEYDRPDLAALLENASSVAE